MSYFKSLIGLDKTELLLEHNEDESPVVVFECEKGVREHIEIYDGMNVSRMFLPQGTFHVFFAKQTFYLNKDNQSVCVLVPYCVDYYIGSVVNESRIYQPKLMIEDCNRCVHEVPTDSTIISPNLVNFRG